MGSRQSLFQSKETPGKTMKRIRTAKQAPKTEKDMLPEYRFDYRKARPNRFAAHLKQGSRVVVIDPDVAEVFATPDSVNAVLRALIESMPPKNSGSTGQGRTDG